VQLNTDLAGVSGTSTSIVDLNPSDPNFVYASALGARPGMASGTTNGAYFRFDLLKVNLQNGAASPLFNGEQNTGRWIMDGAGNVVARIDVTGRQQNDVYVPSGSGFRKLTTMDTADGDITGLTEDGRSLAILGRRQGGNVEVYRLNLDDGKFGETLFSLPSGDIKRVLMNEKTRRVIGVSYDDGDLKSFYFAPELQRLQKQVEGVFPGTSVNISSTSTDNTKVLVTTSGPQAIPALQLVNLQTSRIDKIVEDYPQLRGIKLGDVRRYGYITKGGIALIGLLTLPPQGEAKNLPLIVVKDGGFGYGQGNFDWVAHYLAQRGYAVFEAGTRGSKDLREVASMDDLGTWLDAAQEDIAAGVDDLIAKGIADPKHVCIAGAGSRAYVALQAAVALPDKYACSISMNGTSDLGVAIRDARRYSGLAINAFNSVLIRDGEKYAATAVTRVSPARHADTIRSSVLLIAADRDQSTVVQGTLMRNALTSAKKSVEMVTLKNEDGFLNTSESRVAVLQAIDKFLTDHLGH
jgi:dipeptidyl aminopeptidase/acylaminoacyl peptidase